MSDLVDQIAKSSDFIRGDCHLSGFALANNKGRFILTSFPHNFINLFPVFSAVLNAFPPGLFTGLALQRVVE